VNASNTLVYGFIGDCAGRSFQQRELGDHDPRDERDSSLH
jgi:hypothetical protein